ncbi:MAG: hypothetical protein MZV70_29130 [Desulfobacterales bacterium]|nr:hypothetical protein [Desulfobacterales bacterium]
MFVRKDKASLAAVGEPNEYRQTSDESAQGMNLQPNQGPARKAFTLSRRSIPSPASHGALIQYIKEVRAQLRVRRVLEEIADQMTMGFRIKGDAETKALFNLFNCTGM